MFQNDPEDGVMWNIPSAYELYKKSFRMGSDGKIPFQPWLRRQDYFYVRY